MNRALILFFLILPGLFVSGCDIFNSENETDMVLLRISNSSSIDFNSVYVSFPGAESTFKPVASGKKSSYRKLEKAYRYGYIEVESAENSYSLQPIDYVGEKPLKSGKYTFQLDIENENLILNFIKD